MEYEEFMEEVEKIRAENEAYLKQFEKWLIEKGLSERTIKRHISNADLYINEFLVRYEPIRVPEGINEIRGFFDFFIRKCMWSTPANVKTTAGSIKKFYACMCEAGVVTKENYKFLADTIKEEANDWAEECAIYNDGDEYWDY